LRRWKESNEQNSYQQCDSKVAQVAATAPVASRGDCRLSDRAKRPPLAMPSATRKELNPGDRVERLGNFGIPTGELGTVERANEDDAVVKWDDDGRMRIRQPWLKKL
jgi:hypothetical protein